MKNFIVGLVRDDAGQDLIESGLLMGIITVGAISVIGPIGPGRRVNSATSTPTLP